MLRTAIQEYYRFFDETLKSGTLTVVMIALIILSLGGISRPTYASENSYLGANIVKSIDASAEKNIVEIDGEVYELHFIKIQ